jgi:outer membrane biosynthesis protein TonB
MVLAAVKSWAFQPARLDGTPVRFRKQIQIVVRPEP